MNTSAAQALLDRLRELGVNLWVEEGRLRYRAPKGTLSAVLLEELRRHKADLLPLLDGGQAVPIPHLPEQDSYELSDAQRRLWVLAQLGEGSTAYNIPLHQWLEGELDRTALEAALARLVERHESLRTVFITVAGEPRQSIQRAGGVPLRFADLSREPQPEATARDWGRREAVQPFDLERGPLLRAMLLKLGERRHVLLLTLHHIVCDGVSIAVLERELGLLYQAFRQGRPDPLPPLRIQYRDYAHWQNALLESQAAAVHRDYWREKLKGPLPVLDLPLDFPRPPVQTFNGRELSLILDPARTQALAGLGQRCNASLFILLLALLKVLLYRYTGQRDIIVGSPYAGRHHPDLEEQIGFYLNMLALRDRIEGESSFSDFLAQVRRTAIEAYDHQLYPFDRLIDELRLARDLSRSPLFDVILILQNQADPGFAFEGLTVRPIFEHPGTSKIDLTFCFKETPAGLVLSIEYNTDLFREERIGRMGGHFQALVDSVLADPNRPVGRLNLLPAEECRRLLQAFNATAAEYPRDKTLPVLLAEQAARRPQAPAVTFADRCLDYRRLDALANGLARRLRALGVGPNTLVGLYVERSLEMLIGVLGILKAGGAYLPLDPAYPEGRLAFMLEDARVSVLVTQRALQGQLPAHRARVVFVDDAQEDNSPPAVRITAADLAYVIYTSGSTGKPKGVAVTHGSLLNFLHSMTRQPGLTERDTLVAVTTLAFDIAALELYLPLLTGARLLLASREEATDGAKLMALLEKATAMQATPATWRLLLDAGWTGSPALKVLCGGEGLARELAGQLLARAGSVWNLYGPTETTIWSTLYQVEADEAGRGALEPIGRPLANTQVYILDRYLEPVPGGVAGELMIGGDGVALGYLNRPELTAERFLPDPFSPQPGARFYRTGDLARYRADGTLEFLGRIDQQIKLRGFRLELGEIEAVLAEHPAVRRAVVTAWDDPPDGKRLVAYIVPQGEVSAGELRQKLKAALPDYMVPTIFVMLDDLPLTPNGKIDRRALPPPEPVPTRPQTVYAPPRDDLERALVAAWQAVLGIERVGIQQDFFELGGHSLKAARMVAQLRQALGVELNLLDVFRQPTVAGLAQLVRQRSQAAGGESRPAAEQPTARRPAQIRPMTDEEWEMLKE